jgi:hypothetical protein
MIGRAHTKRSFGWLIGICLLVIGAGIGYAVLQGADGPRDRNVPGATTGPGKTTLSD